MKPVNGAFFLIVACAGTETPRTLRNEEPRNTPSASPSPDSGFLVVLPSIDAGTTEVEVEAPSIAVLPRPRNDTPGDAGITPSSPFFPSNLPTAVPTNPSHVDAGTWAPTELTEHEAYLTQAGFASCDLLSDAVRDCCQLHNGTAFLCQDNRNCSCESQGLNYGPLNQLCGVSPALPLRWECP